MAKEGITEKEEEREVKADSDVEAGQEEEREIHEILRKSLANLQSKIDSIDRVIDFNDLKCLQTTRGRSTSAKHSLVSSSF